MKNEIMSISPEASAMTPSAVQMKIIKTMIANAKTYGGEEKERRIAKKTKPATVPIKKNKRN